MTDVPVAQDIIAKYPTFFEGINGGFYTEPSRMPFLQELCAIVDRLINDRICRFIDIKAEARTSSAVCAPISEPCITFRFVQIKEKFNTPRFYTEVKGKLFSELSPDDQELLDEDSYNKYIKSTIAKIDNTVSLMESLATKFSLVPLPSP
jgi:hypothetical protein